MKEVKILRFYLDPDYDMIRQGEGNLLGKHKLSGTIGTEQELSQLIDDGWEIITAGGGEKIGFVTLMRET